MKYETRFPGGPMCAGLPCLNPGNPTVLSRATKGPLLLADPDCVMGPGKLSLSRPIASGLGFGSTSVSKAFNIPYSIWNYSSAEGREEQGLICKHGKLQEALLKEQ